MAAAYRGHIVQIRLLAAGARAGAGTGAGAGAGRVRARQLLVLERGVPLDELTAFAGGRREWQGADRLHVHIGHVGRGGRGTVAVEAQRVRLFAGLLDISLLLILEQIPLLIPCRSLLGVEVRLGILGLLQVEAPLQRLCLPLGITPPASHGR